MRSDHTTGGGQAGLRAVRTPEKVRADDLKIALWMFRFERRNRGTMTRVAGAVFQALDKREINRPSRAEAIPGAGGPMLLDDRRGQGG